MTYQPESVNIQGDLSRNDVIELTALCSGRRVVEFGMGGSTLLLSRCAAELTSYDTEQSWVEITNRRLKQIPDKSCIPQLHLSPLVPEQIPQCDVLFIDGLDTHRLEWIKRFSGRCSVMVIHDSRSPVICVPALAALAKVFLSLETIHFHPGDSNLLVVKLRAQPLKYECWNETEAHDNRIPPSRFDYVP